MTAQAETGSWPRTRCAALDWLVGETAGQPFLDNLFGELCERLAADGVPLKRATLHLRTLHPQFAGATILWRAGVPGAELRTIGYGLFSDPRFLNSPVRMLFEGAEGVRQRLDLTPPGDRQEFGIYTELRAQGFTDYVALPMATTDGKRHACSWATDVPGGFATAHLLRLDDILLALRMAAEIRLNRRIAKNLLNAYVGRRAGERVLAGEITRGSGTTIRATIWTCDLRGFTQISERWPRDDVIASLNDYFDTMAAPVEKHGGEILKFIGDAMLAIFPLEQPDACWRAFNAALDAREGMAALNRQRREGGREELGFGLALHAGDVMYGNVGSATRLDFTVIGPAVNVASRLESLTKVLRRRVLVSGPFAGLCERSRARLQRLGAYPLRGVGEELEVYGLPDEA
ncbi:MAG TPA: adenylate/guanylate cyclase domain-containing protein [Geminicoccaceae bacterium]|nr:adenylate/guanylate cyclase domain-containing protein [Geminicoccaceae bacterium]